MGKAGKYDRALLNLKRSVSIKGHATSISLEPEFWDALQELAMARSMAVAALIAEIDQDRIGNLSSAIRVFLLRDLQGRVG